MSDNKKDKAVQFVAKLLRLTNAGSIKWTPMPSPRGSNQTAFKAIIDEKTLRLYRYEYEGYSFSSSYAQTYRSIVADPEKRTFSAIALEIMTDGYVTYTFKDTSGLSDLLESASYKAAGADEFIDQVLSINEKDG